MVPHFLAAMRELHPEHYAFTFLGITTGLRPSTLRPLRREGPNADIKWKDGILVIRRSHTVGSEVMETTKTDLHQRLALPAEMIEVLRWHVDNGDVTALNRCYSARVHVTLSVTVTPSWFPIASTRFLPGAKLTEGHR